MAASRFPDFHIHTLTNTERDIARQLRQGRSDAEIALARRRSPVTVRLQIRMLRLKLRVESRAQLVALLRTSPAAGASASERGIW